MGENSPNLVTLLGNSDWSISEIPLRQFGLPSGPLKKHF
jgi:hypothetical protein